MAGLLDFLFTPQTATQTTQTTAGLSPWAQPFVNSMLGAAQQQVFNTDPSTGQVTGIVPYQAYGSPVAGSQYLAGMGPGESAAAQSAVAAPTALQNLAYGSAANMQVPTTYGQAAQMTGAGTGNLFGLGQQAAGVGGQYAQQAQDFSGGPGSISSYMNPYLYGALAPQMQLLGQQQAQQANQLAGQATQAGAFGGSRYGIQQGLQNQANQLAMSNLIGQGYNQAFNQAQQAQQYGAGLGLQGLNAAAGMYGAGLGGAQQLANIGGQALQAQQGIANLQNTYGQQQQALNQAVINQAMQNFQQQKMYPQQQLQYLSGMLSGLPVKIGRVHV